jgi:hypothetical protein
LILRPEAAIIYRDPLKPAQYREHMAVAVLLGLATMVIGR